MFIIIPFLSFSVLTTFCHFDNCHSNRGEVLSYCCFDCLLIMTSDSEHFFIYLAVCISSFENYLFRFFGQFLTGLVIFWLFPVFFLLTDFTTYAKEGKISENELQIQPSIHGVMQ